MDFELPTTKAELTEVLREIDVYYRQYKGEYEEEPLEELTLGKLTFTEKTESAVRAEVAALLGKKEAAEKAEKCAPYRAEYKKNEDLYEAEDAEKIELLAEAEELYEEKLEKLEADAAKRGIGQSSAYLALKADLETEYEEKVAKIGRESAEKKAAYQRAMALAQHNIAEIANYVAKKYEAELETETASRMEKQRGYADEVLKYNNQVEEKLVRARNDKAETENTLRLRYLEITAEGLTEEELTQLGYYKDTIRAIDGYYYTISATAAYDDFTADASMPYYLGPFYNDILYKYTLRKG